MSEDPRFLSYADLPLKQVDPLLNRLIGRELARQQHNIELIASENFTPVAVLEAMGSVLTNKYAEGYPSSRYYGGCEIVDEVEQLGDREGQGALRRRACERAISLRFHSQPGHLLGGSRTRRPGACP